MDNDKRNYRINTYNDLGGFDTQTKPSTLIPFGESETEALSSGDITDKRIADITRDNNGYLIAIGRNSSGSPTVNNLFSKDSSTDISSTWTSFVSDSPGSAFIPNSLIWYRSATYYIAQTGLAVRKYDGSSSTVGNIDYASSWANMVIPKPFIHPEDDILYLAVGQNLAKINNTTYADITSVTVPTTQWITSFTDYNSYLAIATAPVTTGNKSRVYLWGRDTSITTFQGNIDWGEGSLTILENIGGTLIGVSISDANFYSTSSYTTNKTKKLTISYYNGGSVYQLKEYIVSSNFSLRNYKARIGNRLYFGGDYSDTLFVIEKKGDGSIVVNKDRFINNGSSITTLRGLYIIGDYLFTMFDTANTSGNFYRTKVTSSYTNTSFWETNINQNMQVSDRKKKKVLKNVTVSMAPLPAGASVTVKYSVDGASYVNIISESLDGKITTSTTRDVNNKPLLDGYEYQFKVESTGGAEITGLDYEYEVLGQINK